MVKGPHTAHTPYPANGHPKDHKDYRVSIHMYTTPSFRCLYYSIIHMFPLFPHCYSDPHCTSIYWRFKSKTQHIERNSHVYCGHFYFAKKQNAISSLCRFLFVYFFAGMTCIFLAASSWRQACKSPWVVENVIGAFFTSLALFVIFRAQGPKWFEVVVFPRFLQEQVKGNVT